MTIIDKTSSPDGCPPDRKTAYSYEELLQCARGELFDPESAKLPLPNMLMTDRVTLITNTGGQYGKGASQTQGSHIYAFLKQPKIHDA